MSDILFAPSPFDYGAIKLDPVAMVQHLEDPQALEAARNIDPKTYLVHLSWDSGFPWPGKPWYGFSASLVGPGLRAPDEQQCISADMCIPIFPNTAHPLGREPLRPARPFPYDNCYHWSLTKVKIRVVASPEGFDHAIAVKLEASEDTKRERLFFADMIRQQDALMARDGQLTTTRDAVEVAGLELSHDSRSPKDPSIAQTDPAGSTVDDRASIRSYGTYESSLHSAETIDTLTEMGMFGDPSGNIELQPLVHLRVDLGAYLKQEDIASPVHFFEEVDAITHIIQEARGRNPSLPPLREPLPCGLMDEDGDTDNARNVPFSRRRRLRPWKFFRRVCVKLQQAFRLPYFPVWP